MSLENLEKLNCNYSLVSSDTLEANGNDINVTYHSPNSLKRPRTEDYAELGIYSSKLGSYLCSESKGFTKSKHFLSVRHNNSVYHTEDWKPKGCTMYLPLSEDILINTQNIEQISFESDQFFLADDKGNYVGAKPGNAIHLWRFENASRKLYISRSILFLKEQDFQDIQFQLYSL